MIVCVAPNPSIDRLVEVEALRPGEIHRPTRFVMVAGGKGLNVARAAKTLGGDVMVVAPLAGHAGRWIAERLEAAGVPGCFCWIDGETRTSYSVADHETGGLTEFYERGPAIDAAGWRALEETLAGVLAEGGARVVTVSGSVPDGSPPDGHARLARIGAAAGARVVLDASGPGLAAALGEGPIVKVNADEARAVLGETAAGPPVLAASLVERGARAAIVTAGGSGAYAFDGGGGAGAWLEAPAVEGRYPVGSGDAFLAGFAVRLAEGASLLDAARFGVAAGAANAVVPGAGELDPALARRLAGEVRVRQQE